MKGAIATTLLRLLALMPLPLNHVLGGMMGRLVAATSNPLRRVAAINIAVAFNDSSEERQRALLRVSLIESGKAFTEMGPMWYWPADRLLPLVRESSGVEAVDRSIADGRGVVMLTPHLGCWEIAGLYCASRWPMTILYRPPRMAALEAISRRGRSGSGAELARTDVAGVRRLLTRLRGGGMVGILPDQEPGEGNGVFAPWFGESAYTMVLIGKLLRRSGAALYIARSQRLPAGGGYRIDLLQVDPLRLAGIANGSPVESATALNRAVEQVVMTLPEQYQWGYRRYRTRPDGIQSFYRRSG